MDEAAPQAAMGCGGPMELGHKLQMERRRVPVALAGVPDLPAGSTS
jgi:hypothetical protein